MRLEADASGSRDTILSRRTVAVSRRGDIGCLRIGIADDEEAVVSVLERLLDVGLPRRAGAVDVSARRRGMWLAPRAWLVHCELEREHGLATAVCARFADGRASALLYSDCLTWFELEGADAQTLLHSGGFISFEADGLPIGHCKRTILMGVTAVVYRTGRANWLVGVDRSRERYFTKWMLDFDGS